jgi:tetratricopeptide (TPR) repeat protein
MAASADFAARIDAALAHGDTATATAIAGQALAAGDHDPFTLNLVAWARDGLTRAPGDAGLATTLAMCLRLQSRLSEALKLLDRVIAATPGYAVAWLERALTLHQGNSLEAARASYAEALRRDPNSAPAHAGTAAIAALRGEAGEARAAASCALALAPQDPVAHCALARCDLADGEATATEIRMRALLATPGLRPDNRSLAETLLGDALAKLGQPAAAVAAWQAAKADLAARYPQFAQAAESAQAFAERLGREARGLRFAPPTAPQSPPRHAFLLGYPRSGTTLVQTILAGAGDVSTLEELPTLRDAAEAFLIRPGGLAELAALPAESLAALRAAYWQRVAGFGGRREAPLFLDMDPLRSLQLPLIAALFPDVPVIVMRRDPRDVVLSCFRQNFAASPVAIAFATLASTARHYAATMDLLATCLERLPNPVLELRYEALVADFDGETQRLCRFLGLDWSPALRDVAAIARSRAIGTASVGQVRRGLYDGGGQWWAFAAELAPVLPLLAPWIDGKA